MRQSGCIGGDGMSKRRIVVGACGASGMPILRTCLELMRAAGIETYLILSESAGITYRQEMRESESILGQFADEVLSIHEIGAAPASGSFPTDGMLIVPCTMKTVAGIASGYADNLILRAADVTIKEKRPLVIAARETPLSRIHLRNLYELSDIPEIHIIPPMLTFYHQPQDIGDMVLHIAARLLEPFRIDVKGYRRWNGLKDIR